MLISQIRILCFNSIVVRLKEAKVALASKLIYKFQFHSGTIKRSLSTLSVRTPTTCFNSIVVRLKGQLGTINSLPFSCFNSIVVRLKVKAFIKNPSEKTKFQFHSGTIKSSFAENARIKSGKFQFHSGTIKSGAKN